MSVESLLRELVDNLQQQLKSYQLIIALLEQENEAITAFSMQDMQTCLDEKELLSRTVAQLEIKRHAIISQLAAASQIAVQKLKIKELIRCYPGDTADQLAQLFDAFEPNIKHYQKIIKKNKYLLKWSLNSIRKSVEHIFNASNQNYEYGQNGEMHRSNSDSSFVTVRA